MGHSQSYDLRNKEKDREDQGTVRGIRRVSKENQPDAQFSTDNSDDIREEELRERIRSEQLRFREQELESLRIRQHEKREPIIDAYAQSHSPAQASVYSEFNHYDSQKSTQSPTTTYFTLKPWTEVNNGRILDLSTIPRHHYEEVPEEPSPVFPRRQTQDQNTSHDFPPQSPVFSGRLSPLPRQEEIDPHPMPRYIPAMSPSADAPSDSPTHLSEIHAEKRMVVGIEEPVTYVTIATSSIADAEKLHRHPEVGRHPILVLPSQTSYENALKNDVAKVIVPPQKCNVENCTHVEVKDSPVVERQRVSSQGSENKNRLNIFVDENDQENIVDVANDEDVKRYNSQSKKSLEEKLYYNSHLPTISLRRRPIVSFYDKLH